MPKRYDFDVIVVGGGPAGSSAAYACARDGSSVALLEKEESIAQSVRTSGVTWISDAESLGIPDSLYNPVRNYSFCSPNNTVTISSKTPMAAVLDVRKTYRWLAEQAREQGAEIFTGTVATGVLKDDAGRIAGIAAGDGDSRREFFAKTVIDASGFASVVSKSMGLVERWKRFGVGAEYEMRAQGADAHTWWLMVGQQYSPAGYAWIFPLGGDRVRIGVGIGRPESGVDPAKRLDEIIAKKLGPIGSLGGLELIESHYGLIPNDGLSRRTVHDNLILVGDSAGQANPLVLEGIRYAIKFGRLAGGIASRAVRNGDTSKKALWRYERQWRAEIQSKIRSAGRIQDRWIGLTDKQWDAELDAIRELDAKEFVDFIKADFGLQYAARLASRHPHLAVRQLFGMVKDAVRASPR